MSSTYGISQDFWDSAHGADHIGDFESTPWRAVEDQSTNSTRKLVDSDAEQHELEQLLEQSKPSVPPDASHLHFLLYTPLRYPPLRWGSRFGRPTERGIWYASEQRRTCLAEVAYYRLLFLRGMTTALREPIICRFTVFQAHVRTNLGVDLTEASFAAHQSALTSKGTYAVTQALGTRLRSSGVQAFRFSSARDILLGKNVAVLEPSAFAAPRPLKYQGWRCVYDASKVEFSRTMRHGEAYVFQRPQFLVDGKLPLVS